MTADMDTQQGGRDQQRERAERLLTGWLEKTEMPFDVQPAGVTAQLPADPDRDRPLIELRFGLAPSTQAGLYFAATAALPIPRQDWASALALCNDWNSRVLSPRARLCVTDWDEQVDAPIALEAYHAMVPDLPVALVAATGTQLIRAALQFWSGSSAAKLSTES